MQTNSIANRRVREMRKDEQILISKQCYSAPRFNNK